MTIPQPHVERVPFHIDDDDLPVGRVLTRREVLELFGLGSVAVAIAACTPGASTSPSAATSSPVATSATPTEPASASGSAVTGVPSCVVRPELTEGPYFVDEKLNRSDIRPDPSTGAVSEGAQLDLAFVVSRVEGGSCVAFENALVDVWHCDAVGVYSDVQGAAGTKFLRGYQTTDANGRAAFITIYPGWYQGRATHIHFKIRTDAGADAGLEFTSQLFFDDALSDTVNATTPYSTKGADGRLRNDGDNIFAQSGGQTLLAVTPSGSGYTSTFEVGVQV
jgi:protocatechuate 3,4-dioxygenase beta subunit